MQPAKSHALAAVSDRLQVQFLLRAGLAVSIALMLLGTTLKVESGDFASPGIRLQEILSANLSAGDRLMAMGVLVLALTPAFRVLMLLVLWIRERDWRFVAVAITVFIVLSIAIAAGGG